MRCTESCKLDICDNFGNDSIDSFHLSDLESFDDEVVDDDWRLWRIIIFIMQKLNEDVYSSLKIHVEFSSFSIL